MIEVTRTIVLRYVNEDSYLEDRTHWQLPDEGAGWFGPSKRWQQSIEVREV